MNLKTIAPERGINPKRPFFVVADEFQKFATSDFADGLDRLRGYGVHFILSHQHLSQLGKEDSTLLESSLANASNKIYFSISAKDSLTIADELFTGWINGDEIKDEIVQTKFRPVETTRTIVTESDSSSSSLSDQKSMVVGVSRGTGGTTEDPTTIETSSSSDSSSSGTSESWSESHSEAQVPWYEQEEFQEVTGRTYRSPDELRERYKGYLVRQDRRCFQWKLHQAFPRPMQAPEVKPIDVNYFDKKEFRETMLSRHMRPGIPLYAKKNELLQTIDRRVETYIEEHDRLHYDESSKSPWHEKPAPRRREPKAQVPKVPKGKGKKSDRI